MRHRTTAGVFAALLLLAVLLPLFRPDQHDDFPFSTFPMFSRPRRNADTRVDHVVAVYPDNRREALPPSIATGNDAALQAQAIVRQAIVKGSAALERLCRGAAQRARGNDRFGSAVALEVTSDTIDAIAFFRDDPAVRDRQTHHRCWPETR